MRDVVRQRAGRHIQRGQDKFMGKFTGAFVVAGLAASALAGVAVAAPAKGDPVLGKKVFMRCVACHAVQPNAPMKMGPNLAGVVGRKAGAANFKYSAAMKKANVKWDEATLDKWLLKPSAVVPGTSMAFAGVPNAEERAAVIAYLKKPVP
ncbi:cytochrome c, class I [Novosphingobium aromaticivorans DSM 12444]|uniref:Cytochrome c, class I n=2 Tax=Novosphingobium aromaticivorans TaxID=48935 RepID=Q2GA61_NOVAD|nr:cytochrome c, class I [Novosphingobium aromaticivorans DSM 12444]